MFTTEDYRRILRYLDMRSGELPIVVQRCNQVQATFPESIPSVQADLDALDRLDLALDESSEDSGLIRADVLEWVVGGRTSGLESRKKELAMRVARAINLPYSNSSGSLNSRLTRS